jgi:hypothetical protein
MPLTPDADTISLGQRAHKHFEELDGDETTKARITVTFNKLFDAIRIAN